MRTTAQNNTADHCDLAQYVIGAFDFVSSNHNNVALRPMLILETTCADPGDGVNIYTGDSNNNSKIDLGDAITILSYQFSGGATPACFKAADANDDDKVNIADAITILGYQFQSGSMKAPDHTSPAPSLITSANVGCHTFDPADVSVAGCDAPCTDPTPLK